MLQNVYYSASFSGEQDLLRRALLSAEAVSLYHFFSLAIPKYLNEPLPHVSSPGRTART